MGVDPELHNLYNELNKRFFHNTLPEIEEGVFEVVWNAALTKTAGRYVSKYESKGGERFFGAIHLSPHYSNRFPEDVPSVLLHEMIHAQGILDHGPVFRKEMNRINKEAKGEIVVRRNSLGRARKGLYLYTCKGCKKVVHEADKRLAKGGSGHLCRICGGGLVESTSQDLC